MITKTNPGQKANIPRFYGVAWADYRTNTLYTFPIPINLLARWARSLYLYIKFGN